MASSKEQGLRLDRFKEGMLLESLGLVDEPHSAPLAQQYTRSFNCGNVGVNCRVAECEQGLFLESTGAPWAG